MYPTSSLMTLIAAERLREAQDHVRSGDARRALAPAVPPSAPVPTALIARWTSQ